MKHLRDDKEVYSAVQEELGRQREKLEMIASENIVSYAVMEAQGSVLTNKYAEGYPGKDITAAANMWTKWNSSPLTGQKNCSARIMSMCSLIPVLRQILPSITDFSSRAIRSWG